MSASHLIPRCLQTKRVCCAVVVGIQVTALGVTSLSKSQAALETSVFSRRQRKLAERGLANLVVIWWLGKGGQASHGELKSHQILHGQMYDPPLEILENQIERDTTQPTLTQD